MIIWPGLRRSVSAIQRLFNSASFYAPLTHSLVPERGTGSPTFTRASTATFTDWEGVLRTVPSGCARFEGARMVRNLLTDTTDASAASWTKETVAVSGTTITANVGAGNHWTYQAFTPVAGNTFIGQAKVKAGTANWVALGWGNAAVVEGVFFNVSTGIKGTTNGAISGEITGPDSSGYYTCSIVKTSVTGFLSVEIHTSDNQALAFVAAGTETIHVKSLQLEDVTGQADQTASEYVSVGVLSAPYHGAGVDGVKYFNTDRDGAVIPAATNTGYLAEGARTQILATADIRDMTTAAWTLGATMTRARTSVGADGAANSATRLTGGAVAATNNCYTTVVAAASSRTYSALVKRVTGTGPVRIVQTGTETDISTQLNTTGYALVQLNASILNAVMGFKIDTNGDAIDVDFNQFEAGAFASSRIAAAVTRAADVLTYPSAGNIDGTVGWCYAEIVTNSQANHAFVGFDTSNQLMSQSNQRVSMYDGANQAVSTSTIMFGAQFKGAVTWGSDGVRATVNGEAPGSNASFDGNAVDGKANIYIGEWSDGSSSNFGTIRNVRIGQRQLSASEMQAITAAV